MITYTYNITLIFSVQITEFTKHIKFLRELSERIIWEHKYF